jgi:aminotransferase
MVSEFDRRRRFLHSRLNEIEGFSYSLPKGAFYAFVNIEEFGKSSEEFSEYLLKKGKVVTVPGSAFGRYGEGYLRFSYATAYEKIEEVLDRIEKITRELR